MPDLEWQRQPTYELSTGSWILIFQEIHGSYKVSLMLTLPPFCKMVNLTYSKMHFSW